LNPATHHPIAVYAIEHGLHVLITKPATKLLADHKDLIALAKKHKVVCWVEHHKRQVITIRFDSFLSRWARFRYDPVYSDAKAKAATLGEFNFFNAWMSQPKSQLTTFKAWAGKDSDIRSAPIQKVHPIVRTPALLISISTATTFHLTILISAAGSCKTSPYQPVSSQALQLELPQANLIIVCRKRRIRSRFLWIGNQPKTRGTRELLCMLRAGRHHSNLGSTPLNTGIIWPKRYLASDKSTHQF
jgi:hypothetical protein